MCREEDNPQGSGEIPMQRQDRKNPRLGTPVE